jgi:hypothetical protein
MTTHDDVAHNWANQTGRKKRGYAMFYDGDTIYSWGRHFPMARIFRDVVLFTDRSYSASTGKHKGIARRAIPESRRMFFVPDVSAESKVQHKDNYLSILSKRVAFLKRAVRARSRKGEYLLAARGLAEDAYEYSRFFKLGYKKVKDSPEFLKAVRDAAAAELERQRAAMRADKEKIRAWLAGESDRAPHTRIPYVRVRGDMIQTSWGVSVPLAGGMALFRLARQCFKRGRGFMPTKPHKIGGYVLGHINDAGTIRVGCHNIPHDVQRIAARTLGI